MGVDRMTYQINSEAGSSQYLFFRRNNGLVLEALAEDSLGTQYSVLMRDDAVYREFLRQLVIIYEQIIPR
jgi:hypothetical protein